MEGLDLFIQLDFLAYTIAKNLNDYELLVTKLPLSELIKFAFYEGIRNA